MLIHMDTERPSPRSSGIDVWDPVEVLDASSVANFLPSLPCARLDRGSRERRLP